MLKRLGLILFLMLAIGACVIFSPTAAPVENVPATPTAALEPTPTKTSAAPMVVVPSVTPPPSAPAPVFSPHGPFLAFADDSNSPTQITLFDPLQKSRLVLSKPEGEVLQWGTGGLSPDGQYLAYYTGHLDRLTDLSALPASPQHVELNITRIADGSIVFQTPLLNKDYPQNFLRAAADLIANPPADLDILEYSYGNDAALSLLEAFQYSIYANRWSPDGHVLAFASGLEGDSSDVYTYDLDSGAVKRITSGPSEVYEIRWSPDGNWILNSGIYWVGMGMCGKWYLSAANGNGSSAFSIPGGVDPSRVRGCYFSGWVSDHQALVFESENGPGNYNLEVLDSDQKFIDLVWPHAFHSFAFDPTSQQVYVSTMGEPQTDGTYFQQGTYRVDLATHQAVSIAPDMGSLTYAGWISGESIAGIPVEYYEVCFLPSGSCSGFPDSGQKQYKALSLSAGQRALIFTSDTGLWHIYPDIAGRSVTRVYTGKVDSVSWSPNPSANPAGDLALLTSYGKSTSYTLFEPVTDSAIPLPDFTGTYFGGWYWRE